MLLRGKLLFPLWAALARLDTQTTAANGGYNVISKQPKPSYINAGTSAAKRQDGRVYTAPLFLQAQVERGTSQQMRQGPSGNIPDSRLTLILHMVELEQKQLVDPVTGEPVLKVNDKLLGLYGSCGAGMHALHQVQDVRDVPGLYCTEVCPAGEGLGGNRNLLKLVFEDREHGVQRR
jgi:hypothetical protein